MIMRSFDGFFDVNHYVELTVELSVIRDAYGTSPWCQKLFIEWFNAVALHWRHNGRDSVSNQLVKKVALLILRDITN